MNLPSRLPERGPFARLYSWLNQLRDYVASLKPSAGTNTRVTHTGTGVVIDAGPRTTAAAGDGPKVAKWG